MASSAAPASAPAPARAPTRSAPPARDRRIAIWQRIQQINPAAITSQQLHDAILERAERDTCRMFLDTHRPPSEIDEELFAWVVDRRLWDLQVKSVSAIEPFPWAGQDTPSSPLASAKHKEFYKWHAPQDIPELAMRQKLWAELCPKKKLAPGQKEFELPVESWLVHLANDKIVRSVADILPASVALGLVPMVKDKPGNGSMLVVGLRKGAELVGHAGRRNKLELLRTWHQLLDWRRAVIKAAPELTLEEHLECEAEKKLASYINPTPSGDEDEDDADGELAGLLSRLRDCFHDPGYEALVAADVVPLIQKEDKLLEHKLQEVLQWIGDNPRGVGGCTSYRRFVAFKVWRSVAVNKKRYDEASWVALKSTELR